MTGIARRGAVGAVLLAVLLTAGCGGSVAGRALPAGAAAPEVRDVGQVAPCDLLTPAQLDELGWGGASARAVDAGPARSCRWSVPGGVGRSILSVFTGAGLDAIADAQGGAAGFSEDEVAGYPALVGGGPGGPDYCGLLVGIANSVVLSAISSGGCATTRRLAAFAIGNLPAP
jgi:hypothetical protein